MDGFEIEAPRAAHRVRAGQTASMFAFMTVAGLLVAALLMPGPGPGSAFPAGFARSGRKTRLVSTGWRHHQRSDPLPRPHHSASGFRIDPEQLDRLDCSRAASRGRSAPGSGGRSSLGFGRRARAAHLEPVYGAAELSDGVQRRHRKEEPELGLPRRPTRRITTPPRS